MQSNIKVLTGILIVLIGISWFVVSDRNSPTLPSGPVISELKDSINRVDKIILSKNNQTVNLFKIDDLWAISEAYNFSADINKIADFLMSFRQMELKAAKTSNPKNFSKLNLKDSGANAATRIKIYVKNQLLADLYLGKTSSKLDGIYIRKSGEKQTWLASGQPFLSLDPSQWFVKTILNVPPQQVQSVNFQPVGSESFVVEKSSPNDIDYQLITSSENIEAVTQQQLSGMVDGLTQLNINDVERLTKNLSQHLVSQITYKLFNEKTYRLNLYKKDDRFLMSLELDPNHNHSAFELSLQKWAFVIPGYKFNELNANLENYANTSQKNEEN